jgi:hypothetical protein
VRIATRNPEALIAFHEQYQCACWLRVVAFRSGEIRDRNRETRRGLGSLFWARTQRVLLINNRAQAMTAAADITSKSGIMFRAFVRQLTTKLEH